MLCASSIALLFLIGGPQGEVVAQELHDEGRVLVRLLVEGVELGDRVVEGLLGEIARLVALLLHLVEEDRVVEREAEADRVRRRELRGCGYRGDANAGMQTRGCIRGDANGDANAFGCGDPELSWGCKRVPLDVASL